MAKIIIIRVLRNQDYRKMRKVNELIFIQYRSDFQARLIRYDGQRVEVLLQLGADFLDDYYPPDLFPAVDLEIPANTPVVFMEGWDRYWPSELHW